MSDLLISLLAGVGAFFIASQIKDKKSAGNREDAIREAASDVPDALGELARSSASLGGNW